MRAQIGLAVHVRVQVARLSDGAWRMVQITAMEGEVAPVQDIFRFRRAGLAPGGRVPGRFEATEVRSHHAERFALWGHDLPAELYAPPASGLAPGSVPGSAPGRPGSPSGD